MRKITLVQVKVCAKCGRELPTTSSAHRCPYCGGPLTTNCVPKKVRHHRMPDGKEVTTPR